jgi:hypothetical protein
VSDFGIKGRKNPKQLGLHIDKENYIKFRLLAAKRKLSISELLRNLVLAELERCND